MGGAGLATIIAITLIAGAVPVWRAHKSRQTVASRASYRCVGIQPPDSAEGCEAVKALAGKRFLPSQAPKLPLPVCTARRCSCRYVHFDDRRVGDRREVAGLPARRLQAMDWEERRRSRGRRKTDRPGVLDEAQMRAAIAEKRRRRRR